VSAASDDPGVVRRTQVVDIARSVPLGVLYPLETSVLLTIAIKRFDTAGLTKGLVAAASGVGLLASPFVTALARRSARPVMVVASTISVVGAVALVVAASGPLPLFVLGAIVGIASVSAVIPLVTVTYGRNFPAHQRGKRVGVGMAVKVAVSALAGLAMGAFLDRHLGRWWVVVLAGAAVLAAMAWLQLLMPSTALPPVAGRNDRPWPHFHLIGQDRKLRLTLGAWMLMGFGNLMLLPLRVEYLAAPRYGIAADAAKITLLTVTVPSVVRLASMPLFGVVFDKLSFFASRIVVNLLFAAYVAAFFTGTTDVGLFVGAAVLGIAGAGGDLMWGLWVTKFAPPDRVADYMGLHTFFTGIRAVVAPIFAFLVVASMPLATVAWMAAGMMVASALVLLPEARAERASRASLAGAVLADTPDFMP
jgi:predicted MFS family arabinose efflux permease